MKRVRKWERGFNFRQVTKKSPVDALLEEMVMG